MVCVRGIPGWEDRGKHFPTSLSGVLVFSCAIPPASPPARLPPTHTTLSHTQHNSHAHNLLSTGVPCTVAATVCVARVAGDIDLRFAWQVWHLATSTCILRGGRGTYGTGLALVARLDPGDAASFCVAGVALFFTHASFTSNTFTRNSFTHLTSTCISCTYRSSTISFLFPAFPTPVFGYLFEVDMWGYPAL